LSPVLPSFPTRRSSVLSPWIVGFLLFTAGPMIASLLLSFTDWSILGTAHWVGTRNYSHLVHDSLFWKAMRVTFVFSAISVPLDVDRKSTRLNSSHVSIS